MSSFPTDALALLTRARLVVDRLDDDELGEWLSAGLDALQSGEDPRPALKLAAIDAKRLRLSRRDKWLQVAYEQTDHSALPWPRCVELAREIKRFEVVIWPRWRELENPPENASELRSALFRAKLEDELPASARSLYRICCNH